MLTLSDFVHKSPIKKLISVITKLYCISCFIAIDYFLVPNSRLFNHKNNEANIMSDTLNTVKATLFDQLGGEGAVNEAVDIFYRKVLADDRINRFFDGVDIEKQAVKQQAFLTMAFGGPANYSDKDMREGHAKLVKMGLDNSHFDAVVENLAATLIELSVSAELIGQVAAIAETTRTDVLGK
jgi:hemoglobin